MISPAFSILWPDLLTTHYTEVDYSSGVSQWPADQAVVAVAEPDYFHRGRQTDTIAHTGVAHKLISYFFSVWQVAVDLVVFLSHSLIYLFRQ